MLFLVLSASFWFVNTLDKDKETQIILPIKYTGIPQNIGFSKHLPATLTLNLKDKGLKFITYYSHNFLPLEIDLSGKFLSRGSIEITQEYLKSKVIAHLLPSSVLQGVSPSSFSTYYEQLSERELTVGFVSQIVLAPQYMLSNNIHISPNKIKVYGPKNVIDTMQFVPTEFTKLDHLSDSATLQCKLKYYKHLRYQTDKVQIEVPVEQYTERTVRMPISIINCPSNIFIRTFPAYVNVTYSVGLSRFNSVSPKSLNVVIDYNDIQQTNYAKQKLKVVNNNKFISNFRMLPQEVEFLLEKK